MLLSALSKDYYYASLTQSIFEYLTDMDYTLSVFISHNKPEIEKRNIEAVIEERADALLLIPVNTPNTPDYLDIIKKADIPVLFLTSRYPESDIPCVMCDLYNGIQEMQKCLYSDGKRRMHLLTGKQDVYCLELREQGFTDFIKQNGCEDGRIIRIPDIDYDTTYRYILENGTQGADVILCVNDMMALGVINALRALNLSVPDDVAVTGYDDVIYSVTSPVPITTIRQDIPLLAKTAAEEILKMAKGEYRSHDIPLLPCDIVIRNSAIR